MTKILAFSGSSRRQSHNQAVVTEAAKAARDLGAEVTIVNLADYAMAIYNADEESEFGIPERAQAFKSLLMAHDGFLIASPEYNSSYPALLKNALDWASRKVGDEPALGAYRGKVVGLMAASPGAMGGMRVLVVLRMLMQNLGCIVTPKQCAIGHADSLFDDTGNLVDEKTLKQLNALAKETVDLASKLTAKQ